MILSPFLFDPKLPVVAGDVFDPTAKTDGIKATNPVITGPGEYTVALDLTDAGLPKGCVFSAVGVTNGEILYPDCIIDIKSVKINGEEIKALSELSGTAKVSADIFNAYDKNMSAAVYLLYYNTDNRLLDKQVKSVEIPMRSTVSFTPEFEIKKPEGTAYVSVIMWQADGMPITEQIEIK